MSEIEEVDKRLTADFIMDEAVVNELLCRLTKRRDDIIVIQTEMGHVQQIMNNAAWGVMCKLTEFTDVLSSPYPQDEDLLEEIIVYNHVADYKEDVANKYGYTFTTQREDDMILCGFHDIDAIGGFREVVRFPFSYIHRMDWLYRLEVELGVFRLKEAEKYSHKTRK